MLNRWNLPNQMTLGRIAIAPLIAALPFMESSTARFIAFVLYLAAAITDYWDGRLARDLGLVTDLGRLLDPLADKVLFFATLIPMCILMAPDANIVAPIIAPESDTGAFAFRTPFGELPLPWWIALIVVSRELFMTIFRHAAARKGQVIAAITSAKWKTIFQSIWVGSAFFWFFADTLAVSHGWNGAAWNAFALFNGTVGAISMFGSVALNLYSMWLYLWKYSRVLVS